jgi:transmembrane sensor
VAVLPPIKDLFQRYLANESRAEELDRLISFFGTAEEVELRELIIDALMEQGEAVAVSPARQQKLELIYQNIHVAITQPTPAKIVPLGRRRFWQRLAIAASVIFCMSIAGYFILRPKQEQLTVQSQVSKNDLLPGSNKATLTLANGKQIVLTGAKNGQLAVQGNMTVNKTADGRIIYNQTDASVTSIQYNTTSTPRGGQYHVILADGTQVWLNAASSITYPTAFTGNDRTVSITGEAYFEVTHNLAKPFRVKSKGQTVEVLGTHFNINAYPDEQATVTTLFEGSVKINEGIASVFLKPGQQALVAENNLPVRVIDDADLDQALGWKNEEFYFNHTDIQAVMRQIARWYDVEIIYTGKIPKKQFSGTFSRNTNASKVLALLEYTGLNFKIEGRKIIVK